ncbi:hypothetical protein VT84_03380 [Gemmata sp. SH-PL17]|uniref:hypothetical protein n=1 Tax=Gemmata sp. SH-PL17 TaxID=1630693 RepID=UPI00078D4C80|nr:hypothetical protein [Gemmata sp. SH-PL17]AMV23425.1 hypothetical protein VT84_03380 [Gemmata sp. SH-PL17]
MAGLVLHVNSGEVALAASAAKTVLQIKAPANQRVLVKSLRLFGKAAAGGTGVPVKVRATRSTANFGTLSGATSGKNDSSDSETIQTTCGANATVEPTTPTDTGLLWEVPDQSGVIEFLPPGMEIRIPGGTALNIECTSTGTPTVAVQATYEE